MYYFDVFILHNRKDTDRVLKLEKIITEWGFTCYIAANDPKLQRPENPKQLSQSIRLNLRKARCLIYAFSENSPRSRWMPWEIGFFDGRWGDQPIGLYDLDQLEKPPAAD